MIRALVILLFLPAFLHGENRHDIDWDWRVLAAQIDDEILHVFSDELIEVPLHVSRSLPTNSISWQPFMKTSKLRAPIQHSRVFTVAPDHKRTLIELDLRGLERRSEIEIDFVHSSPGNNELVSRLTLMAHVEHPLARLATLSEKLPLYLEGETKALEQTFEKYKIKSVSDLIKPKDRLATIRIYDLQSSYSPFEVKYALLFSSKAIICSQSIIHLNSLELRSNLRNPIFQFHLLQKILTFYSQRDFKGETL